MHTTLGPRGTAFIHNSAFSGAVIISRDDEATGRGASGAAPFSVLAAAIATHTGDPDADVTVTVRGDGGSVTNPYTDAQFDLSIPAVDLRALLAERFRDERITALEQADTDDLFRQAAAEIGRWAAEPHDWTP